MPDFTVVVTHAHLDPAGMAILEAAQCRVVRVPKEDGEQALLDVLARESPDAILARGGLSGDAIRACSKLRVISRHGAGHDAVDLAAAQERGVPVLVAAGANAQSVAELTIGLMIGVARSVGAQDSAMRAGQWGKGPMGLQLAGRSLGLVGLGVIGQLVARYATAIGMRVRAFDPGLPATAVVAGAERVATLDALLSQADVLSLHCPLTPQTRGIICSEQLGRLPTGSILINAARGPLVDEAALVAALQSGQLRGAGLDTFEQEPLAAQSPLRSMSSVLMTPHIGAHTDASSVQVAILAAGNLVKALRGEPIEPRCVVNFGMVS